MASANLVILMGNLTRDPEVRYTPSGQAVGTLNLAVNYSSKNKDTGEWDNKVDFFRVTVLGKQAENCEKYLVKGRAVYLEGSLKNYRWEDEKGESKSRMEVLAQKVQFLPYGKGGSSEAVTDVPADKPAKISEEVIDEKVEDEEIPF